MRGDLPFLNNWLRDSGHPLFLPVLDDDDDYASLKLLLCFLPYASDVRASFYASELPCAPRAPPN